ncbi:glutamate receptor 2.2-like isoform X2 [Apium graveolens]|uniref:glutamate receptor 2.2-like isoform X2 n=1 Tax=Apium graveolens TaxID=4045 RepID=UPI003D79A767
MGFFRLYLCSLLINSIIIFDFVSAQTDITSADSNNQIVIDIGLILDFGSSTGIIANSCISMAFSDFYTTYPHYSTRLALHHKNSNDVPSAASSASELVYEEQVDAIIGPQTSNQARLVAGIGGKSHVPIISFSETSSSLWPSPTPYFIPTAVPDSFELEGIAFLVKELGWHDLVVIYEEDMEEQFGNGFIPSLTHTFKQASVQISYVSAISISSSASHIKKEMRHLRSMQTRVFLVHVTCHDLTSRLFSLAQEVGMMSKGTAWIITDALSNSIGSLDATTVESMEGVLGMRPYIPKSKNLENFKIRWDKNKQNYSEKVDGDFITCLRAYDIVWALATAAEKIQFQQVKRSNEKLNTPNPAITQFRISETGTRLVEEILKTRFIGLSGEFKLKHGKLEAPAFEIINIIGNGDRTVGYWTPRRGFSRKISSAAEEEDHGAVVYPNYDRNVLKPIIWPGDSTQKPRGWDIPGMDLKLRVEAALREHMLTDWINIIKARLKITNYIYYTVGFVLARRNIWNRDRPNRRIHQNYRY